MERSLFKIIKNQVDYPNISILLPTHKTSPDNNQDIVVLKNLRKEAERRLRSEFGKKEVKGLIDKLNKIVASIDIRQNLDGLAVFVNHNFEKVVRLPFPVKERVIIDRSFATRDLLRAINRGINYYVLSLSSSFVRLFEAHRDKFSEITEGGFPYVNPHPRGSNMEETTSIKDQKLREFFKTVESSFIQIYNQHPTNIVLVGVEKNIAFYKEISGLKNKLLATIEGNHDNTAPHELGKLIWPEVKNRTARKRAQIIKKLEEAVGTQKVVTGIEEVWKLAMEGKGELMIVEEGYVQPALVNSSNNTIIPLANPGTDAVDDIVDEIAEKVVSTGGKVIFTDNNTLDKYNKIALLLKY